MESAKHTQDNLLTQTKIKEDENSVTVALGLGEFVDVLGPKVDKAIKIHQEKDQKNK